MPVEPRGSTRLGISFRPRQVEAFGLDPPATFAVLLAEPFELVRLAAYWSRIEPSPDVFDPEELDWQVAAAERAGKQIILNVGAVKAFGYPEFFVPGHQLGHPLPERSTVDGSTHPGILAAASAFVTRVIERYRDRKAVVAWQVEHEAVDPLGLEHSWRLATSFVQQEVEAARRADPGRPILLNGYLATSLVERLPQRWRTRGQGDSLAVAGRLADIVGVDYYPRHALVGVGPWTLYLMGGTDRWPRKETTMLREAVRARAARVMISEGQAEPWERITTPPNPAGGAMASCLPDHLIANYNSSLRWARNAQFPLDAYLFWGAEYWVLRRQAGDSSYLDAVRRLIESSHPAAS